MAWRAEALALVVAALAACGGGDGGGGGADDGAGDDGGDTPYPEGGALSDRSCPEASFLSYDNFGAPFFAEFCTGCHSSQIPADMRQDAPPGVDFETLDGIRAHAELIYLMAADGYAVMPPAGGPAGEARALLGEWLACGAP